MGYGNSWNTTSVMCEKVIPTTTEKIIMIQIMKTVIYNFQK